MIDQKDLIKFMTDDAISTAKHHAPDALRRARLIREVVALLVAEASRLELKARRKQLAGHAKTLEVRHG